MNVSFPGQLNSGICVMKPRVIAASIAFIGLSTGDAFAYLDPGTGSILLQALIATVASSLFVIKMYWHKFRSLLGLNRNADDDTSHDQ
jgi:hypothetical protein